ncbi:MAG: response regulator [Oscillospiraceae bacterium]|nr:response regulator [Oscillospiraceae bacterium]
MKLLMVDDSSSIRKVIKAAADMLRIETEEAEDGLQALELLERIHGEVDLILLDWNMPGMNGYDFLVEVKKDGRYGHIPVMMVTTEGQQSSIIAAVRAGAANYLTKPFTAGELEAKIMECVGGEG